MHTRIAGLLGIARRAGHVAVGFDAVVTAVKADKAKLVLCAADISPKTAKEWQFATRDKTVASLSLPLSKEELGKALGYAKPVGLTAVDDEGFAKGIRALILEQSKEE